jgi:hypothetical protein
VSAGFGREGERSSKYGRAETKPDLRSSSGFGGGCCEVVLVVEADGVRIGMIGLRLRAA